MARMLILPLIAAIAGPAMASEDPASGSPIVERNKYVVMQSYPSVSLRRGEEGVVQFASRRRATARSRLVR